MIASSFENIDNVSTQNNMSKIELTKKVCTLLFYSSLILLIAAYFFSPQFIQILALGASLVLGISLILSTKGWLISAVYLFNICLLTSICLSGYYHNGYNVECIIFLPLILFNRVLLENTKHFWILTSITVFASLIYVGFCTIGANSNSYIVDGVLMILVIFIILKIVQFADLGSKALELNNNDSLQILQKITDLNPHQIYAKSKEGKFIFVNKQFAKEMGLPKEEIIGKTDFEIGVPKAAAMEYISSDIQVMDSGETVQSEMEVQTDKGENKYFQFVKSPFKDEDGETIGILGLSMDRSAEKKYEKELFSSKLLYQTLFDNLNDAVLIYDYENEKICSFNRAASLMFKTTDGKDLSNYTRYDLFPKEINGIDVQAKLDEHKDIVLDSKPIKGDAIMKRANGELFECKIVVYPTHEPNAEGIIVVKDVSLENKAKRSILKSKNHFMQIYDNSPVAIALTDIETMKVTDINITHKKVFGYSAEEIREISFEDLSPEIDLAQEQNLIQQLKEKEIHKSVVEKVCKTKDGNFINVRTSRCIINREGKDFLLEFMEDITSEKQNDERYKFLFENAFEGIAVSDLDKKQLIYCNQNFKKYFNLNESFDIADFDFLGMSHPIQDNGLSAEEYRRQVTAEVLEKGYKEFSWKFKLPNGDIKYSQLTLFRRNIGNENLVYSIYKDITNELLTQNALRESEKRFRLIFNNAFDGLYFYNYKKEKIILANKRLYELFESSPDRLLIDKPHLKPEIQPDGQTTIEKIQKAFMETLQHGKSRAERIYEKSDGTIVHLEISTFLLSPPDDDIIVSIYKDITDYKRAEDAMVINATQEEKLGALGRELSSYTLFSTQKSKLLQELSDDLKILAALDTDESKMMIEKIRRKIASNLDEKENWISFKVQFERVHTGFFNELENTYAELTTNDLKHCAYVRMGLSNAEIADILFVGKKAVEMSHYRLKKKLGLPKEVSLKQAMFTIGAKSVLS